MTPQELYDKLQPVISWTTVTLFTDDFGVYLLHEHNDKAKADEVLSDFYKRLWIKHCWYQSKELQEILKLSKSEIENIMKLIKIKRMKDEIAEIEKTLTI